MAAQRSLRLELIATLAVVLMMAAVSLSLATELLGRRRHAEQQRDRLAEHAQGLSVIAGPLLRTGGAAHGAEVEQVLRPSLGALGITTIEIHRVGGDASGPLLQLGLPEPAPHPVTGSGRNVVTLDDGRVVVDEPVRTFGGGTHPPPPLVLRIIAQPTPWTRVSDYSEIAILALGIGGVLLLLGFVLVDVQVLRPLREVQRGVEAVAHGDLQAHVPTEGPLEFRQLSDAFNDMTRSLREQLEQIEAQRARLVRSEQLATVGRIAAGTAHEVGNPLAAILGYVELLLDPRSDPPVEGQARELLERTKSQLERIQTTIGQLLEYSRPSPTTAEPLDVVAALDRLLSLVRHDPRTKDATIRIEAETESPVLAEVDPARFDQIVQNLVLNAARATGRDDGAGTIELRVRTRDDEVEIDVADDGPGVADDDVEQLFQPFFSTAPAGEGTGLGLAISLGLAEGMGGRLQLHAARDADGLGGAVFRLTVPRAATSEHADEASIKASTSSAADA